MSDDQTRRVALDEQLERDILSWDVRTWSAAVRYWESVLEPGGRPLRCLELGAGSGGPSLWLALQGHDVLCTNWRDTELLALPLHEAYGVADRIEYRDLDATQIPYENEFDLIVFKSVIGGVGDKAAQDRAMRGVLRALKPGGRLLFAENLRSTMFHQIARAIAYKVRGSSWRYPTIRELRPHLDEYGSHELRTAGFIAMFAPEHRRDRFAVADEKFFNRIVPRSWHYVSYGTAVK